MNLFDLRRLLRWSQAHGAAPLRPATVGVDLAALGEVALELGSHLVEAVSPPHGVKL